MYECASLATFGGLSPTLGIPRLYATACLSSCLDSCPLLHLPFLPGELLFILQNPFPRSLLWDAVPTPPASQDTTAPEARPGLTVFHIPGDPTPDPLFSHGSVTSRWQTPVFHSFLVSDA